MCDNLDEKGKRGVARMARAYWLGVVVSYGEGKMAVLVEFKK